MYGPYTVIRVVAGDEMYKPYMEMSG